MSERELKKRAAEIFADAAKYIRKYGWQVSGMSKHGKPRCSMGALQSSYKKSKWEDELSALMYSTLYEELDGLSLTQFNYKHKSGEKVARLYENAALSLVK